MSDRLTARERAAIAAYRGEVTRCPDGVWDGDKAPSFFEDNRIFWNKAQRDKAKRKRRAHLRSIARAEADAACADTLSPDDAQRIAEAADG